MTDPTDADDVGDYVARGARVVGALTSNIERIDMTGIFGANSTILAEDMVVLRVW